jgi:nicotinate-nucleotide pyrophosphorylase (carboxylating)
MPDSLPILPLSLILDAVKAALREDLGNAGDITSAATIPAEATATAAFVARRPGVVSGLPVVECTFREVDPSILFLPELRDGDPVAAGGVIARVEGPARGILTAERVALNYLCHLSGIATATAALVARVRHTKASILDTRKTTPGLRVFEKYAVRCGGGVNHRFGLYDAILIKDNHIAVAGGVAEAIHKARAAVGAGVKVEVEVGSLAELDEAMSERPDIVMLDNMSLGEMREAVGRVAGRAVTEASGNVTPETVTHSAPALDIGLDVVSRPRATAASERA